MRVSVRNLVTTNSLEVVRPGSTRFEVVLDGILLITLTLRRKRARLDRGFSLPTHTTRISLNFPVVVIWIVCVLRFEYILKFQIWWPDYY
jgi:hypothetical protein